MPTLRSVDHFGFTVPNLDEAIDFFVENFGGELIYRDGPNDDPQESWMRQRIGVDPDSRQWLAVVRIGLHTNFEIFQYETPDQQRSWPLNSDHGSHHIGFYVDNIDQAYAYLQSVPGVTVREGPNSVTAGPISGERWFYFNTPWGQQLEITSCSTPGYFDGLPAARKAPPAFSWR